MFKKSSLLCCFIIEDTTSNNCTQILKKHFCSYCLSKTWWTEQIAPGLISIILFFSISSIHKNRIALHSPLLDLDYIMYVLICFKIWNFPSIPMVTPTFKLYNIRFSLNSQRLIIAYCSNFNVESYKHGKKLLFVENLMCN